MKNDDKVDDDDDDGKNSRESLIAVNGTIWLVPFLLDKGDDNDDDGDDDNGECSAKECSKLILTSK